jgi:glycosyltransferase involved in cell wall biosynthesis
MELVRDALAAGWKVTIAAGGDETDGADAFRRLGVECISLPWTRGAIDPVADVSAMARIYRICRRARPDAVLAFTVKPVTYGLIAAAAARVPIRAGMITGVGYALMEGFELKRLVSRFFVQNLYRIALRASHIVYFQNGEDEAEFLSSGLAPRTLKRVRIGGSGVDLERYVAWPMPVGAMTFVMISRLLREKGVAEFAEAARVVKKAYPETQFILVGPIDSNPTAISMAEVEQWVSDEIIDYRGPQSDVRPFLRNAHVFVLPSYREGTPRSGLEALATGRPILTTDVPGCREVVRDFHSGRLVEPRSSKSVAEAMTWFINHPEALGPMAVNARNDAQSRFDVHVVNGTILEALAAARFSLSQPFS